MSANGKITLRLFKKHVARLLTIMAIVIVSVGFMSGIGEVENKIHTAVNEYYATYNVYDIYLKSKNPFGFTKAEQDEIVQKFGEENVKMSFCYETENEGEVTRIYSFDLGDNRINAMDLREGVLPEKSNEIVVERETTDFKGGKVGDKINVQGREYTVCGISYNPVLMTQLKEPSFQYEEKTVSQVYYIHASNPIMVNDIYVTLNERELFDAFGSKYEDKINDVKAEVSIMLGEENVSVLSLYENYGIYSLCNYAEKVGLIGIIFVVFFLLVTLLVTYSTMTRLLDEERALIACQKTLGISNLRIVLKYVLFVAIATLVGGGIAYILGIGLTSIIYNAFNLQYAMPAMPKVTSVSFYLITFAIILVATTLLTLFSGLRTVRQKPSSLLVPKAPKKARKTFLERIPFIWNKLSFRYKSTFRNVFLFRSRFLMTVISVIGSTVLIFAGMGLLDCSAKMANATSLVLISGALIVFSAVLCALVIYNITNINVSERNREIATLMVLGYRSKEITKYIYREIYIMSFIGAILGVPIGVGFIELVFSLIDFGTLVDINWWTYLITPCVTMLFSFISTLFLKNRIIKTDMNASLKSIE